MANLSDYFPDYHPAMMEFDGSTGFYNKAHTSAGTTLTFIIRFIVTSTTAGAGQFLVSVDAGSSLPKAVLIVQQSDHGTVSYRNKLQFQVFNGSGSLICRLGTSFVVTDSVERVLFASYNGTTGAATFFIDGVDADDTGLTGRVLGTGTPRTGAGGAGVGAADDGSGKLNGSIGYSGYSETQLTNPLDFMDPQGKPLPLDESGWTEWGAQPLFWNEHGDMRDNLGSAGDMTKNGTVIVGNGGN